MTDQGPYGQAADAYWRKAWSPFPVKGKNEAIPRGVTGLEGKDPAHPQIQDWITRRPFSNVAVRANGWVSIDVDVDGDQAFLRAQEELGDLPGTWTSTSWGKNSDRRQHFYRVPVGFDARLAEGRFVKRFGAHVDIIHKGHRYSVVAPSRHPDTGNTYQWYRPDGEPAGKTLPKRTEDLAELPQGWLDFLAYQPDSSTPDGSTEEDWMDGATDDHGWTETAARAEVARMLERIRTVDANVNTQAGGAMREIGRFVPALMTMDEAIARCVDALEANPWHSDGWNVANGKDWTAITLAATSVARGAEEGRELVAEDDVTTPAAGEGRELAAPGVPMDVARQLLPEYPGELTWWRGDFYTYQGTHWEAEDEAVIRGWLWRTTEHAVYLVPVKTKDGGTDLEARRWAPTDRKVKGLQAALGEGVLQRAGDEAKVLALENGILTLAGRTLTAHTPEVFNLTSRPFAYVPTAKAPGWEKFLEEVLPGADEDQAFLQEWFGYVLSGRTDIHAIASLAGLSRSGKGTILRILSAMTGMENVAAGRLDTIAENFGLESLIGKSLLTFGDVRWNNSKAPAALQRILEISGEDRVVVPRKGKTDWQGTLGVRIMFAGNEVPRFSDPGRAMSNRLRIINFRQTFAGREDYGLTGRLMEEMPGIFNWALDGLDRLSGSQRFTESASSLALRDRVGEGGDAITAFAEEYLREAPGLWCVEDEVMEAYEEWTRRTRRSRDSTTADTLRSALLDMFPEATNDKTTRKSKRTNMGVRKVRAFQGIALDAVMPGTEFDDL